MSDTPQLVGKLVVGDPGKDGKWYGWSHRAIFGFKTREEAAKFAESVA
jgi:hypothetical protein